MEKNRIAIFPFPFDALQETHTVKKEKKGLKNDIKLVNNGFYF